MSLCHHLHPIFHENNIHRMYHPIDIIGLHQEIMTHPHHVRIIHRMMIDRI